MGSYSGNPTTSTRDAIRFLCRDTAEGTMLLSDEEVDWLASSEANTYMAAARAVEMMAARAQGVSSKSVGGLSISYDLGAMTTYAETLRARGRGYQVPTAGGLSVSEKAAVETDLPVLDFKLGLHRHPEVT